MDPEGEFTAEFFDPDRGDWLLNPLDERAPYWTPWFECERVEDMEAQAASLFRSRRRRGMRANTIREAARRLYAEWLEKLPAHDPRVIPQLIAEELGKRPNQQRGNLLSTCRLPRRHFATCNQAPGCGQPGSGSRTAKAGAS